MHVISEEQMGRSMTTGQHQLPYIHPLTHTHARRSAHTHTQKHTHTDVSTHAHTQTHTQNLKLNVTQINGYIQCIISFPFHTAKNTMNSGRSHKEKRTLLN